MRPEGDNRLLGIRDRRKARRVVMASRFTDYVTRGRALRDWREKLTSSSRATGRFARSEAILGRPGSCGPRGRSPNAAPHSRVVGSCGQGTRAFPSSPWTAWRPTMRWSEAAASPSFRRSLAVHCAQGTVPWCRFITPGTTSSSPISRWEHARSTRRCNARTVTEHFGAHGRVLMRVAPVGA